MVTPAKSRCERCLALDPGTLDPLADCKRHCREEALAVGGEFDEAGFVFSADGLGKVPRQPDTISDWFRQVARAAGVQATMHGLRHYDATQMLSSRTGRERSVSWRCGQWRQSPGIMPLAAGGTGARRQSCGC